VDVLLHGWQLDPPFAVIGIVAAALLYAVGLRRRVRRRSGHTEAAWFAAGLATLVVALQSPLAAYDESLFWAHMLQHVLLLVVAPPLLLLGRPFATSGRAVPLAVRRPLARALVPWFKPLRSPPAASLALALFTANMAVWHVPALFDTTLRSTAVHELEHALFLVTGLYLWSFLVGSRLGRPVRALYASLAMIACWLLALTLGIASSSFYTGYSVGDQHLAAGIMWVPGSIPFVLAVVLYAYRWLEETAPSPVRGTA
jgi:cytochrome c oxidase assembly factor CtaG